MPWAVWAAVAATVSVVAGSVWDISWHVSIGRDTFWTPPHLLIQLCAAIGGLSAIVLIAEHSFRRGAGSRAGSVRLFGLRAPVGAFLCGWGALAMLTSAPFDNWWHQAYGLDVKVVSPPHVLLAVGAVAIVYGGFALAMAERNRAAAALESRIEGIFVALIGAAMLSSQAELIEYSSKSLMHSAIFYRASAIPFPLQLALVRRVAGRRWACLSAAAVYTLVALAQEWILPLFPAEQKLGPVLQRVPYMAPLGFPLLMMAPAALFDLAWRRLEPRGAWTQAVASGVLFLAAFAAVQWPFADFLMTRLARNWIFGSHYQFYMVSPLSPAARYQFIAADPSPAGFWRGMAIAAGTAVLTSRIGLAIGSWLRRVQR